MRGLFNKVSDPLKIRHTLDCIAGDINYLNIFTYLYRRQNRDMPTTKCKIEFSIVLQSLFTAKNKIQIWHIYSYI